MANIEGTELISFIYSEMVEEHLFRKQTLDIWQSGVAERYVTKLGATSISVDFVLYTDFMSLYQ